MAAMNKIADAYVQIIPTTKSIKNNITDQLSGDSKHAAEIAGESAGNSLASKIVKAFAAFKIGDALASGIKNALAEGSALQQSRGGIETLFNNATGDASEIVKKNAEMAFRTAGLSANEYMETATSFSAGLIASMGNDTMKAADVADMAIRDMSDNANKFGTDMSSIQTAYAGFAKQNYTMLDNLKLGYGGTKSEMERLLKDASKLEGAMGKTFDINKLSDVYEAIHLIQEDIGVTGTTAKEASSTFQGSMVSMQAAVKDLLGNLTTGDGNLQQSIRNLVSAAGTYVMGNLLPMLGNLVSGVIDSLPVILAELFMALVENGLRIMQNIADGILSGGSFLSETFKENLSYLFEVIEEYLPWMLEDGIEIVKAIVAGIMERAPEMISKGWELVQNIAKGLIERIPDAVSAISRVIAKILYCIGSNMPEILKKGLELAGKLFAGVIKILPQVPGYISQIIRRVKDAFGQYDWASVGRNIIEGIKNGLLNAAGAIAEAARSAARSALNAAKSFLGIHSPSRVFADEVGKYIPAGMAVGIEANTDSVRNAMDDLTSASISEFDAGLYRSPAAVGSGNASFTATTTINVYGAPGQNITELAEEIERILSNNIYRRSNAWA